MAHRVKKGCRALSATEYNKLLRVAKLTPKKWAKKIRRRNNGLLKAIAKGWEDYDGAVGCPHCPRFPFSEEICKQCAFFAAAPRGARWHYNTSGFGHRYNLDLFCIDPRYSFGGCTYGRASRAGLRYGPATEQLLGPNTHSRSWTWSPGQGYDGAVLKPYLDGHLDFADMIEQHGTDKEK